MISDKGIAVIDGALISVVTPEMARARMQRIRARYPNIGGAFVWTLVGADPELMQSLRPA